MNVAAGPPILTYHYIGDPPVESDRPYFVETAVFREQMQQLARHGFQSISLLDYFAARNEPHTLPRRPIIITFDDGHRSFYEEAAPVLAETGFTATMFIVTDWMGRQGFLGSAEIQELTAAGHCFESHTVTHRILTKLTEAEAREELFASKDFLEDALSKPIRALAYRGGHFNDMVKALAAEAGYECAVTVKEGLNSADTDSFELRRNSVRHFHLGLKLLHRTDPFYGPKTLRFWKRYFLRR
ncbi:MAG: polysaccharide deacetylase family protein [Pseudomonadota bacterium]